MRVTLRSGAAPPDDLDDDPVRRIEKRWPGCFQLRVWHPHEKTSRFVGCAVAVGPRVFLSAAHTLLEPRFFKITRADPATPISVVLDFKGQPRQASFWVHPAYVQRHPHPSADLLIGAFGGLEDLFGPQEIRTVDVERTWFRPEPDVWVSGWGNARAARPADGRFSAGVARVAGPHPGFAVELEGGARLAVGDSGSGVFSSPGADGRVLGIAIAIGPDGNAARSVVAILSHPRTRAWLEEWVQRERLAIAGIAPPRSEPRKRAEKTRAAC